MKKICFFGFWALISSAATADWNYEAAKIRSISSSWETNYFCINLENGSQAKIDLTTETGRADLSIALAAKMADKPLNISFSDSLPLLGGCNTGDIIRHYGTIQIEG